MLYLLHLPPARLYIVIRLCTGFALHQILRGFGSYLYSVFLSWAIHTQGIHTINLKLMKIFLNFLVPWGQKLLDYFP